MTAVHLPPAIHLNLDMPAIMNSPTRSRSTRATTASPSPRPRTAPGKRNGTNFRPLPYQVSAEIDAFFGLSRERKRELALRYREGGALPAGFVVGRQPTKADEAGRVKIVGPDGNEEVNKNCGDWIWFDSIERDEFQSLLAASAPTSPTTPAYVPPSPMSSCTGSRRCSSLASARALSPNSALGLDLCSFPLPPDMELPSFGHIRHGSLSAATSTSMSASRPSGLVGGYDMGLGIGTPSGAHCVLTAEHGIRNRPRRSHSAVQRCNVVGASLPRLGAPVAIHERFRGDTDMADVTTERVAETDASPSSSTPIRMPAFLPLQRRKANAKELDDAFGPGTVVGASSSDGVDPLDTSFAPVINGDQQSDDGSTAPTTKTTPLFRDPFAPSTTSAACHRSGSAKRRPAPLQLRSNLVVRNPSANALSLDGVSPLDASPRSAGLTSSREGTPAVSASQHRHRRPFSVAAIDSPTLERLRTAMSIDKSPWAPDAADEDLIDVRQQPHHPSKPSSSSTYLRKPRPSHGSSSGCSGSPTKAHALLGLNPTNRTLLAPGGLPTGREVYDDVDIPCPSVRLTSDDEDDEDDDWSRQRRRQRRDAPAGAGAQDEDEEMSDTTTRAGAIKSKSVGKLWGRVKKSLK